MSRTREAASGTSTGARDPTGAKKRAGREGREAGVGGGSAGGGAVEDERVRVCVYRTVGQGSVGGSRGS